MQNKLRSFSDIFKDANKSMQPHLQDIHLNPGVYLSKYIYKECSDYAESLESRLAEAEKVIQVYGEEEELNPHMGKTAREWLSNRGTSDEQ